jgi:hypothetical protein
MIGQHTRHTVYQMIKAFFVAFSAFDYWLLRKRKLYTAYALRPEHIAGVAAPGESWRGKEIRKVSPIFWRLLGI